MEIPMRTAFRTIAVMSIALGLCASQVCLGEYWTEKAQNPSWFPYKTGAGNERWMDLPIPTPSQSDPSLPAIVSPNDPLKDVQGYWPLYYSVGTYANGRYYVGCGQGPQVNWAGLTGNPGYAWPSNSYGQGYSFNRQSGWAIYDPVLDTWTSAKWDEVDPVGFNYINLSGVKGGGNKMPEAGDGTLIGSSQSFAFDWDEDGTDEIFLHAGYPHWDGNMFIYDPDNNVWTNSVAAATWPSGGNLAQYYGGTARIGTNIYCIGGGFWGADGQCNMQIYHPMIDAWTVHENIFPESLRDFGIASAGTKIFLLGGLSSSDKILMLETTNITAGLTQVGTLSVGVSRPSVVSFNGLFYIVGGLTTGGPTNLFQVFNPLTGSTAVGDTPLPVNAYGASCSVAPDGTFYFGGAVRYLDTDGKIYNTSRLWVAPLPEQTILISPSKLAFWQTNDLMTFKIENASGFAKACTNISGASWLTLSDDVVTVGGSLVTVTAMVNRTTLNGPTNTTITVAYDDGSVKIAVSVDTPRPIGSITPSGATILVPKQLSFDIHNSGSVPMMFTNNTAAAFIENVAPLTGSIAPYASTTVTFTVAASAPRPSQGTVVVSYNSYDGSELVYTVINAAATYYVSTTGDDGNDGTAWTSAWQTIAHAVTTMPQGNAEDGPVTLRIGAGTFAAECTDASGTNWFIDLSGKAYINLIGEGPDQTILTRGGANWRITFGNDISPTYPVIKLFNANNIRLSGIMVEASDPPAYTDGLGSGASAPDILAVIGIQSSENIQIDHVYLDGLYTGMVYNAEKEAWQASWLDWWYFGMCVDGVSDGIMIDHVLVRGFRTAIYNNNYAWRQVSNNTGRVEIDHCTFVEGVTVSTAVFSVQLRVTDQEFGPSFIVHNCIVSDIPWQDFPGAELAQGLTAASLYSLNNLDYTMLSQSNQFWSVGVPAPGGVDFVNEFVVQEDPMVFIQFTDYTNEQPVFVTSGGLPYSTDIDTEFGTRDVGWNPIPEPVSVLALLLLAVAFIKRT